MDSYDLGFHHTSADITSRILDFIKPAEWFPFVKLRGKTFAYKTNKKTLSLVLFVVGHMLLRCTNKLSGRIPEEV